MIKLKKYLNLLFISLIALTGCSGRGSDEAVKLISVSLSSNSVETGVGSSINLTWSSTNAGTCSATGDWSGIKLKQRQVAKRLILIMKETLHSL
jgi:hypothetical protein